MKPFLTPAGRCLCIGLFILLLCSNMPASAQVRMRANLLIVDQTGATLMDGNMTNYHSSYSNIVDGNDIWKMSNFGENFGILRSTANLVIERRNLIQTTDTTFFRMWNVQQRNYRLQVIAENLHTFNLVAFVRDRYLNQDFNVQLNDTTDLDFTINSQPGSYAQNRFLLIYMDASMASPVPVTFTGLQAHRKNDEVFVSWTVSNEQQMQQYELEHSTDAVRFENIHTVAAKNSPAAGTYGYADTQTPATLHYYRVKATGLGGKVQYSGIARVAAEAGSQHFTVYPNPVQNKILQLQLNVPAAGTYSLSLTGSDGRKQAIGDLQLAAGFISRSIGLPGDLPAGIYHLQIVTPQHITLLKTISVL